MKIDKIPIDTTLAKALISDQFPQWKGLAVRPVEKSGWDNRTFRLGEKLLIRMPSAEIYECQVEKEAKWLPKLQAHLPVAIPEPVAIGMPGRGYPLKWSILRWLEGEPAIRDDVELAKELARFLKALQSIDTAGGPAAGLHSFYRGGLLSVYDGETRKALELLHAEVDANAAIALWEKAVATAWAEAPVWVHGDISPGNLLVNGGKLTAVIDFGQLNVGDPACDLSIAWTFFAGESRKVFLDQLGLDEGTVLRGKAWALWKALVIAANLKQNSEDPAACYKTIHEVLQG